jgi:hypothetical protein
MVLKKDGTLFHRKDDKWILYIPKDLSVDSQFPFSDLRKGESIRVTINVNTVQKILIITEVE